MTSSSQLTVPSTPQTVRWGRLPGAGATPVAELDDGGTVSFETVSHEGLMPDQGGDPVAFFGSFGIRAADVLDDARELASSSLVHDARLDGPHIVTGPVLLRGARAGDLIRVEVLGLERRTSYGIVSNRHGKGVLAGEFPQVASDGTTPEVVSQLATVDGDGRGMIADANGHAIRFALREFLGLVGVAPNSETELSSRPPGRFGGNLDVRHIGKASSWLLPAQVDGALVYVGDPHFAQGNGEVALTAFEAPLRATLRLSVERAPWARRLAQLIGHPIGETRTSFVVVGLAENLDDALTNAVRHAVSFVVERTGLSPAASLAYLSAAADFEISQAVNGIRGVHCVIEKRDLDSVAPS